MHLQVVIAFALLLWWPDGGLGIGSPPITDPTWAAVFVWGKLPMIGLIAMAVAQATRVRLATAPARAHNTLSFYHRAAMLLRFALLAGVAGDLFLTVWPRMIISVEWLQAIPGLPQLCLLVPYLLGLVMVWWLVYPVEQASRDVVTASTAHARWRFAVFNLRHHVLIVALPLALIVVAYDATQDYRARLVEWTGSPWAPEAVVGGVAAVLFVLSPIMLRYVWATSPLPDGPLRRKLLDLCRRIDLRVREILVWHSDGMVVNAAVMGLFPRVRYIMLSDTLLESMTDEEIEAVFGHEAGHVRHHHIPYFLLFALASMLIVSGVMELLTRMARSGDPRWQLSEMTIQVIGLASVIPIWGIAFGWISRRFERQADVFGARCASPPQGANCRLPCAVHDEPNRPAEPAICATGSRIFVQALRKVALLNGIPPTERSWRHSSIASRMSFLTALAGDPMMTRKFLRSIHRIKLALVLCCAMGLTLSCIYIWNHPAYRRAVVTSVFEPLRKLIQ